MNPRLPNLSLSLALAALLALAPAAAASRPNLHPAAPRAQVIGYLFTVNTTGDAGRTASGPNCDSDASTPGDQCTLRSAIQAANANVGEDGIEFSIPPTDPGCDGATGRCTIAVGDSLNMTSNVQIVGPGADKLTVRLAAGQSDVVFDLSAAATATLHGMTVSNAFVLGGAISVRNGGTLTVSACVITDNLAVGIINYNSTLNVTGSTISRNRTKNHGGIANLGGTANITNSTIVNNVGSQGGGIANSTYNDIDSTLNVTNCTIADNFATEFGSGIYNGISNVVNVKSTLLALNGREDVYGTFVSHGYNVVGVAHPTAGFTQPTDQAGTFSSPLDAKLDPAGLLDHGGTTRTIALLPGSPAIDAGTSDGLAGALSTDQRGAGFPRTVDDPSAGNVADGTDVGAFESRLTSVLQFSSATYTVGEGAASAAVTVKRTGNLAGIVTVSYFTSDGTAKAGQDYTVPCGSLTFTTNQTSRTFSIPITGDALDEPNETLNLGLGNLTGVAVLGAQSTAILTINDNDPPPKLSIDNAPITEADSGARTAVFTVTLSAASSQTITVNYATADGTAKAPGDYTAKTGTLTFLAGETIKALGVAVPGDLLNEANETFVVNLSAPSGATIADAQGLCVITDNDPIPSIIINNIAVAEPHFGTASGELTVRLSAASGRNVSVNYATADGTAKSPTDYVAKTGTLTITAGQTTGIIVMSARSDTLVEPTEIFVVNLSGAVNATIADAQADVYIHDIN